MDIGERRGTEKSSAICFVCSTNIDGEEIPIYLGPSSHWKATLSNKIERLLGSSVMIVVGEDDTICQNCSLLLGHCDKLETDLQLVKQSLKEFLNAKYNLEGSGDDDSIRRPTIQLGQDTCWTNNNLSSELVSNSSPLIEHNIKIELVNDFVGSANSIDLACLANSYLPVSVFKCKYCSYKTRDRPNIMNHLKLHSKKVIYKCSKCDRKFISRSEIESHIIYVHRSSTVMHKSADSTSWKKNAATSIFKCSHCSCMFSTQKALLKHEAIHQNEPETREYNITDCDNFPADDCVYQGDQQSVNTSCSPVKSPQSAAAVSGIGNDVDCEYDCVEQMLGNFQNDTVQVDNGNSTNTDLHESREHIEITGSELSSMALLTQLQEEAQIEECENSPGLGTCTSIIDGIKDSNILPQILPKYIDTPKERIMVCARCGLRTTSKTHMKRHVNSHVALNKKTYTCHICKKVLTTRSNLKRHVGNHDLVPVVCGICGQQLTDRLHRKQHTEECHSVQHACTLCDESFPTQHLRRSHELTHKEIIRFKCGVGDCSEIFITEIQLQNHRYSKHGLEDVSLYENAFKCHICCKILTSFHNLRRHLLNHDKSIGDAECNVCQLQMTDRLHLRHHMEEKHPGTFQCIFCREMFSSKKLCNSHELTHPERLFHKCDVCLDEFPNLRRLKKHKETSHREPQCRICYKEIKNISKLIEHEKRHIKYLSKFTCSKCDKQFLTPSGLRYHMAVHTGVYSYMCDVCKKGFNSLSVMAEHKATHTKEARHTCERCGRNFSSNSTYRIHRLWHDNPFPYKCNICERKFKHTSLLAVHKRRVHTGERPYKCPYCSFAFNVSSSFKKHVILHTRNFPYKCTHCDKGFTTRSRVALHLVRAHDDFSVQNEKPKPCEYKMVLKPEEQQMEGNEEADGEECGEEEEQIGFVTLETVNATEHAIYAIFENTS